LLRVCCFVFEILGKADDRHNPHRGYGGGVWRERRDRDRGYGGKGKGGKGGRGEIGNPWVNPWVIFAGNPWVFRFGVFLGVLLPCLKTRGFIFAGNPWVIFVGNPWVNPWVSGASAFRAVKPCGVKGFVGFAEVVSNEGCGAIPLVSDFNEFEANHLREEGAAVARKAANGLQLSGEHVGEFVGFAVLAVAPKSDDVEGRGGVVERPD
jgi:hypothetical protein